MDSPVRALVHSRNVSKLRVCIALLCLFWLASALATPAAYSEAVISSGGLGGLSHPSDHGSSAGRALLQNQGRAGEILLGPELEFPTPSDRSAVLVGVLNDAPAPVSSALAPSPAVGALSIEQDTVFVSSDVARGSVEGNFSACYLKCLAFNGVPGQVCNAFYHCDVPGGCYIASRSNDTYPYNYCSLQYAKLLDDGPVTRGVPTTFQAGWFRTPAKNDELAAAGDYRLFRWYTGFQVDVVTAVNYLDCRAQCAAYESDEGLICNIFSACSNPYGCTLDKGNDEALQVFAAIARAGTNGNLIAPLSSPVGTWNASYQTCFLGYQPDLAFLGGVPAVSRDFPAITNFGSGIYQNETREEGLRAAGNFTWGYVCNGAIQSVVAAYSPMDCFNQCKAYNKQGKVCNVFQYCVANCTAPYTSNQGGPACYLSTQRGLVSWSNTPDGYFSAGQSVIGSGWYIDEDAIASVAPGNYTFNVQYSGELVHFTNINTSSPADCYNTCKNFAGSPFYKGVPCNTWSYCGADNATGCYRSSYTGLAPFVNVYDYAPPGARRYDTTFAEFPGRAEYCYLMYQPHLNVTSPRAFNVTPTYGSIAFGLRNGPSPVAVGYPTNVGSGVVSGVAEIPVPDGQGVARGTFYWGSLVELNTKIGNISDSYIDSAQQCQDQCKYYNEVPGQLCTAYNWCNTVGGCNLHTQRRDLIQQWHQCDLRVQTASAPTELQLYDTKNRTVYSDSISGTYTPPASKFVELASAGNYTFFANYNGTVMQRTTAATWLECHDKCASLNNNSYCNVFTFCTYNCTDGFNGFNIPKGTCHLKVQSDLMAIEQQPQRFPDAKGGVVDLSLLTNLGSGVVIAAASLRDRFKLAGNLTWNVAYDAETYRTFTASSPYDCYQQCLTFNDQEEGYANTYMYCGANSNTSDGCYIATSRGNTTLQFGQCACQVQSGLAFGQQPRQIAYLPATSVFAPTTSVASGVIFSNATGRQIGAQEKFASIGSLRLNTEYDGTVLTSISRATARECFDACKSYNGMPGCNVFAYCLADMCRTNSTANPVSKGACQLKNQQSVRSESDQPAVISNTTSFASGIYIAPPKDYTGVIIGSVLGGVAAIALAAAAVFFGMRLRRRRQQELLALESEFQIISKDLEDTELVSLQDLPLLASAAKIELALDLHDSSLKSKAVIALDTAHHNHANVFDDTAALHSNFSLPAVKSESLEDTWKIDPDNLKCRRKPDGSMCLLGKGGCGSVYLGLLHGTTDVAIKVAITPTPAQQQSFIKEILILKACRHPNIISFLGASVQAEQTLLVMEAMPGGDLLNLIQNDYFGRYTWYKRGREIALDICKGLVFFHAHNILHLDLKSPNILLNAAAAKIADVGLGRKVKHGEKAASTIGASVPWCAPEQLRGEPCTPATDMFAFGVILWELCTGEQPTERRHFRPVNAPKEAPAAIAQLIKSCLSAKAEARPTATEAHGVIMFCGLKA